MNSFPTLRTQRLHLRELVASDAPAVFAIHSDADSMRWFGSDPMTDLSQAQALIETFAHWRTQPNPTPVHAGGLSGRECWLAVVGCSSGIVGGTAVHSPASWRPARAAWDL